MNIFQKLLKIPLALNGYFFCDPYRNGEYKFLKKYLQPGMTVFDVGANIGEHTLKIKEYKKDVIIHCFEPIRNTFNVLKNNTNESSNIILNNIGLSDKSGNLDIYIYGELYGTNSVYHKQQNESNLENILIEKIHLTTIDDYILSNSINKVNFIKIDVEGHELNVLKGATKSLNDNLIKCIQFEYNYTWVNTGNYFKDTYTLLRSHGFTIYRLTPWGKIKISKFIDKLENFPPASNYIALKK